MTRFFILSSVVIALIIVMVFQATTTSASHVVIPSDLAGAMKDRTRIRVGGKVADLPIKYTTNPTFLLSFSLQDREPAAANKDVATILVEYPSVKPDMFTVGRDVIVDGDFIGGKLIATNLLTQCPSKYEPPKPGDSSYAN